MTSAPSGCRAVCPSCGEPVFREEDEAAVRCTNAACPAQLSRGIEHFASKDAMDIDGLGPQIVESLIREGLIHDAADLYRLRAADVAGMERMGEKSAANLIAAIEKSKTAGLERLLYALGIRNIGAVAAAALAGHFGTLDGVMAATAEQLCDIPDFGEITAGMRGQFLYAPAEYRALPPAGGGRLPDLRHRCADRRQAGRHHLRADRNLAHAQPGRGFRTDQGAGRQGIGICVFPDRLCCCR